MSVTLDHPTPPGKAGGRARTPSLPHPEPFRRLSGWEPFPQAGTLVEAEPLLQALSTVLPWLSVMICFLAGLMCPPVGPLCTHHMTTQLCIHHLPYDPHSSPNPLSTGLPDHPSAYSAKGSTRHPSLPHPPFCPLTVKPA
jgi:hypothetical protein